LPATVLADSGQFDFPRTRGWQNRDASDLAGNQSNGALNGMVLAVADNRQTRLTFRRRTTAGSKEFRRWAAVRSHLGQACTITVTFAPQSASPLSATLNLTSPVSADNDTVFAVPIVGTGVSGTQMWSVMQRSTRNPMRCRTNRELPATAFYGSA